MPHLVPIPNRRRSRWLVRALLLLALLVPGAALVAVGGVWWVGKRAEPVYAGEVMLPGLAAPVQVTYGPHAVPTVRAGSIDDLLFAQGYLVAAERMWQMDLLRRLAGGRLAEVFGAPALMADRFHRTIGLPQAARDSLAALATAPRRLLERYADGVNAYRAASAHRLPLEYRLAGFQPAPWTPTDSLVIGEYMAWINAVNLREELTFLRLASRLGNARALALFPADLGLPAPTDALELPDYRGLLAPTADGEARAGERPDDGLTLASVAALGRAAPEDRPGWAAQVAGNPGHHRGHYASQTAFSNAWAVSGARTSDGSALLASDPHLAAAMPGIWYLLELQAPGLHVSGGALPGVPLVLLGHNEHLAWGLTAAVADVQDLVLERLTPDGAGVLRPDGTVDAITTRVEMIPVAGRDEPVTLPIRSTRHGVLIDALVNAPGANPEGLPTVTPVGHALALRTTLDTPERAIVGLWQLNTATTIDAARAAILEFRHAPLNLIIAHRDGGIGWQMGGALPVRGRGSGAFPVPGWEAGYGWRGFSPALENPGATDPPDGQIVSANQRMLPPAEAARLGHAWLPPFRAQRIGELLAAAPPLDPLAMAAMQRDRVSVEARLVIAALARQRPALDRIDPDAATIADQASVDWRFDFPPDSRRGALFALLKPALYEAIFGDELGPADLRVLMALDTNSYGPLVETLIETGPNERSAFWDDVTTPDQVETPAEIWGRALRAAQARLEALLPDPADRRLDRLRQLTFPHAFDADPRLGPLFNVGPIGRGGDSGTIDVASVSPNAPRRVGHIPSLRVVFTPGDWRQTRGTLPLGQSGHRFSRYRTDQLTDWIAGENRPWPWQGPIDGTAIGTLTLLPDVGRGAGQ